VVDWTDPDQKRRIFVEAYLVESQSLSGLSGSPVFVRPEVSLDSSDTLIPDEGNRLPDVKPVITGGSMMCGCLVYGREHRTQSQMEGR
jgi:hypothetical protein